MVNVDQSIALGDFQELVRGVGAPCSVATSSTTLIAAFFDSMQGALSDRGGRAHRRRCASPVQEVVLGVWAPLLELSLEELDALVALAGGRRAASRTSPSTASTRGRTTAPGCTASIPTPTVEVWDGDGHYPHLVEPARFLDRLRAFESTLA